MFNKTNIGKERIREQHKNLDDILEKLKQKIEVSNNFGHENLLDQLFLYLLYHLEYENSMMRLVHDKISEHIQEHYNMLGIFMEFLENNQQLSQKMLLDYIKKWHHDHLELDYKLISSKVSEANHILEHKHYSGNIQVILFENAVYTVVYGVMNNILVQDYLNTLQTNILSCYHDKEWFAVCDLRHWNYATKDGYTSVELNDTAVFKNNSQMIFMTGTDPLTQFIANKVSNKLNKPTIQNTSFHEMLECLAENKLVFGNVIKTFTVGDFYFTDEYYLKN